MIVYLDNMKAILTRIEHSETQTLGELDIWDGDEHLYHCKTLELEVDKNERRDDAIPHGDYKVVKRWSEKYKEHFHILNVPNRNYILIHSANYSRQLLGCVAVGKAHIDIDSDSLKDVTSSKQTMKELNEVLPKEFNLLII